VVSIISRDSSSLKAFMKSKVRKIEPGGDYRDAVSEAAACLAEGGVVVFPTETVYGVGARATNPKALARLREIKQRPDEKPFTVHIGSRSAVDRFVPQLQGMGRRLTEKAWPGPLTLIFDVPEARQAPVIQESSPEHVSAMYHEGTIGIRCPDDYVALGVLGQAGVPIVAASANPAGAPAPVTAEEALATLDGQVDLVLDAGRTRYARPSTIVHVTVDGGYEFVREGVLDERTIRRLTNVHFLLVCSGNTCRSPMAEGLLRHLLAERIGCSDAELEERGYHVESAGVSAFAGASPSPQGVEALRARNIDISSHRSRPLTLELVHRADYIFTMTRSHLQAIHELAPGGTDRARLLNEVEIEDPIGSSEAVYARTADQLERALRHRLEEIPL
jgi:protein-tyrosine phosphatase